MQYFVSQVLGILHKWCVRIIHKCCVLTMMRDFSPSPTVIRRGRYQLDWLCKDVWGYINQCSPTLPFKQTTDFLKQRKKWVLLQGMIKNALQCNAMLWKRHICTTASLAEAVSGYFRNRRGSDSSLAPTVRFCRGLLKWGFWILIFIRDVVFMAFQLFMKSRTRQ